MYGFKVRDIIVTILLALLFVATWTIPLTPAGFKTTRLILGIIGTLLMISTELLYSLRKEKRFTYGSLRTWLRLHIFTGLAGPALVLWHTDLRFNGLAGAITYLTIIVVISGIIGRYIYRLIPRTIKGRAKDVDEVVADERAIEEQLELLMVDKPNKVLDLRLKAACDLNSGILATWWRSTIEYYRQRLRVRRRLAGLSREESTVYRELKVLMDKRAVLERRLEALQTSKKLLSNWIAFHKPLTLTLFALAGVHVVSMFYYGRFF